MAWAGPTSGSRSGRRPNAVLVRQDGQLLGVCRPPQNSRSAAPRSDVGAVDEARPVRSRAEAEGVQSIVELAETGRSPPPLAIVPRVIVTTVAVVPLIVVVE